jgi:hypothetical protein
MPVAELSQKLLLAILGQISGYGAAIPDDGGDTLTKFNM